MPTVSQIAEVAGVSKSTVSLALNNRPGVSDETRLRIQEVMNQLKEQEEQASLHTDLGGDNPADAAETISLLVLHPQNVNSTQFFRDLLQGIHAAADLYSVRLRLASNEAGPTGFSMAQLYLSEPSLHPSGLLVIAPDDSDSLTEKAIKLGLPVVWIEQSPSLAGISTVEPDDEGAGVEAVRQLAALGHRKIALLGGFPDAPHTLRRTRAYRHGMSELGLTVNEDWLIPGMDESQLAQTYLAQAAETTAVIFVNQYAALTTLPVLQDAGLKIPQDLSVVTFDDTEAVAQFTPPLTCIAYPLYQQGYFAVKSLMERIRQPAIQEQRIVFRTQFIQRQSCAAPRRG
jgi:DNA-binding LacI/PurR family transcriptional regulator